VRADVGIAAGTLIGSGALEDIEVGVETGVAPQAASKRLKTLRAVTCFTILAPSNEAA